MEILVCLVVMTIIVMGGAALQLQSTRLARHSAMSAEAALLAAELAQNLRSVMRVDDRAWPDLASGGMLDLHPARQAESAPAADCRERPCTRTEAIAFELWDWSRRVAAVLPNARALVCRDAQAWDEAQRRYNWSCLAGSGAALVVKLGWQTPFSNEGPIPAPQLVLLAE